MKCGDQVMSLPDNHEVVELFFNGCLSDSQRILIRLRSVNYQGMIFHYPFYCVQKAVYMLADEHKNIKDQLLFRTNPSKAQK